MLTHVKSVVCACVCAHVLSGRSVQRRRKARFEGETESSVSERGSVWPSDSLTVNCHVLFRDGKLGTYLDRKSWAYWDLRGWFL